MACRRTRPGARRTSRLGASRSVRQRLHEGRRGFWLSALAQDVRYGARMIGRNRLLSCVVVLIMGLGIGTTTAVFNAVNAVAFAPPVSDDPDSFVQFVADDGGGYQVVVDTVDTRRCGRRRAPCASLPHGRSPFSPRLSVRPMARVSRACLRRCNLVTTLSEVPPLAGRLLQQDDCGSAAPVAVMSRDLWRGRFASDPRIVGRSISYGGHL